MEHLIKEILLITCNCIYKNYIRASTLPLSNIHLIFEPHIKEAINIINSQSLYLILIDSTLIKDNKESTELLAIISQKLLNLRTIIVSSKFTEKIFLQYARQGMTYVTDEEYAKSLIPVILKYPDLLIDPPKLNYKNLVLYPTERIVLINNCKIRINLLSTQILECLIKNNGKISKSNLITSISEKSPVTKEYIEVTISRLNKITKQCTGIKLIRNRYGMGYYLTI